MTSCHPAARRLSDYNQASTRPPPVPTIPIPTTPGPTNPLPVPAVPVCAGPEEACGPVHVGGGGSGSPSGSETEEGSGGEPGGSAES